MSLQPSCDLYKRSSQGPYGLIELVISTVIFGL